MSNSTVVAVVAILGMTLVSVRGALAQAAGKQSGSPPNTASMVVGGVIGGVAGMALGIVAGNTFDHNVLHHTRSCFDCVRWGAAAGAGMGATVGIALGVHAFNDGRGRFVPVLGHTAATVAAFWAASYTANRLGLGGVDDLMTIGGVVGGIYMAQRTERSTTPVTIVSISVP